MIHLSEVLGLPVFDATGARLGRVDDLHVDVVHNRVAGVFVKHGTASAVYRWSDVETFSPERRRVTIAEGAEPITNGGDGEAVQLRRDVLDRQIIDIQGRKVVRVNDIMLQSLDDHLVLKRVEVGLAAAVRRLLAGVLSMRLVRHLADGLSEHDIPWDYVGLIEPRSSRIRLKVHQQLARMHPADLADIIEDLGRVERRAIVSQMAPDVAAEALAEAEPSVQAAVVEGMGTEQAADVLEEMQPDEAADVLGDLPTERSRELLEAMEADEARDVRELLAFPENSAGGVMTTDFFKASAEWSVGETLAALAAADADLVSGLDEIPIVDDADHLVGIAPLVQLARADRDDNVARVVRAEHRPVTASTPFTQLVELFGKYHLRAVGVTDEFGVLVGLIGIDDVLSRLTDR